MNNNKEFVARHGLIAQDDSIISGSLTVTGGINAIITGSINSASFASTASYVLPLNQDVYITGSYYQSGSMNVIGDITTTGNVGINTTSPNAKLDVNGNSIITGSLTVTETITAQRLNVQFITSSIAFITGSTKFGTDSSNTHQFTGSIHITGSISSNNGLILTDGAYATKTYMNSYIYLVEKYGTNGPSVYNFKYHDGSNALYLNATSLQSDNSYNVLASSRDLVSPQNGSLGFMTIGSSTKYPAISASFSNNGNSGVNIMYKSASVDYNGISLTSVGNVGIGTSTPLHKLDVAGTIQSNIEFRLGASYSRVATLDSGGGFGGGYNFNWSNASPIHDSTGAMAGIGYNSPGHIQFYTNTSQAASFAATERMRITSAGFVGIGTTTPTGLLHIYNGNAGNNNLQLQFQASGGGNWAINPFILGISNGGLSFVDILNNRTPFVIDASANVGINTTNPTAKLHVDGQILANEYIVRDGGAYVGRDSDWLRIYGNAGIKLTTWNGAYLDALTVFANGNVGIGTNNPSSKLTVSGSSNFIGNVLITGSCTITGDLIANISGSSVSSSYAATSSISLATKANSIIYSSFAGTPLTASITFDNPYPNTNYSVAVTGEDARIWTIQNKTAAGFIINSNSNESLVGYTDWIATSFN